MQKPRRKGTFKKSAETLGKFNDDGKRDERKQQ